MKVTLDDLKALIASEYYHIVPGSTLTICVLALKSGFNVIGESACINPESFDESMGRKVAFDKAFDKLWALHG